MHRILLVDDDEPFRKMLRLSLVRFGHEVLEAGNGREAMRLINDLEFELVITDLVMPEQEGLETIQELHRTHPSLKIIAMSGGGRFSAQDFLVIAKIFGAHRTFTKPFSIQQLNAAIGELLAKPVVAPGVG